MYCGYFAYRKGWHGGGIVSDAVHRKGCSPGGGQRSVCESGGRACRQIRAVRAGGGEFFCRKDSLPDLREKGGRDGRIFGQS